MRRAAVILLLGACASPATIVMPDVPVPQWVGQESIWVDPDPPGSQLNISSSGMQQVARTIRDSLIEDGFEPGAPDDPRTIQIRCGTAGGGTGDIEMHCKLVRGERTLEVERILVNQQPCWSAASFASSKLTCAAASMVNRILSSRTLAQEHEKPVTPQLSGRLAVLDLRLQTRELREADSRYFTDLIRAAVLKYAPQLEVMTRENLLVLLQSTGKDLANCEGECEVDTGRRIGADEIISGELVERDVRVESGHAVQAVDGMQTPTKAACWARRWRAGTPSTSWTRARTRRSRSFWEKRRECYG